MKLQEQNLDQKLTERRTNQRRIQTDRRTSFRFLMEKPNRRSGSDRRGNFDIWSQQIDVRANG